MPNAQSFVVKYTLLFVERTETPMTTNVSSKLKLVTLTITILKLNMRVNAAVTNHPSVINMLPKMFVQIKLETSKRNGFKRDVKKLVDYVVLIIEYSEFCI